MRRGGRQAVDAFEDEGADGVGGEDVDWCEGGGGWGC